MSENLKLWLLPYRKPSAQSRPVVTDTIIYSKVFESCTEAVIKAGKPNKE